MTKDSSPGRTFHEISGRDIIPYVETGYPTSIPIGMSWNISCPECQDGAGHQHIPSRVSGRSGTPARPVSWKNRDILVPRNLKSWAWHWYENVSISKNRKKMQKNCILVYLNLSNSPYCWYTIGRAGIDQYGWYRSVQEPISQTHNQSYFPNGMIQY